MQQFLFLAVFLGVLLLLLGVGGVIGGRHQRVRNLLQEMESRRLMQVHGERVAGALRTGMSAAMRRMLQRLAPISKGTNTDALRLMIAGSAISAEPFAALRLLAGAGGAVAGMLAGGVIFGVLGTVPVGCLTGIGGYIAPDLWLGAAVARRKEAVDRELLYFLDFLALSAQSGLSMDQAVQQVSIEFPGILSDAFAQVQAERGLGQWNEHALGGLAERLGHRDVQTVVDALVRAGRFGSRTATVLRELAGTIRRQRNEGAREHANKAGTAIILPVAVFIMPAIVMILGYPAVTMVTGALGPHH